MGSPSTGGRTGGDPHQRVEERGGGSSSTGGRTGGGILINGWMNGGDPQVLEMLFCSSEMEMKSKISIIIKTGFRPL